MYPVRNCTRHSAIVHHHHLTQSVRTDIQPHPSTAVTPSNTSWFTSTFSLIQPQLSLHQTHPGSRQHSTSSSHSCHSIKHILVHVNIQPQTQSMSTFNLIQPQLSLHQTHPGSRQHSTSDSVHVNIQPHPATAVTPSNTSWFTSTFNLRLSPCQHSTSSSHSRHSVTHISDSVHADTQPHPHTGGHCTHPQAAHVQIQQPPHTGGHTIRHIHRQHTSKFNNLHTQVVTPSGTSTGSTRPNSTTSTHRWSHHQAHPQAAHVQIQQPPHTGGHTIRHIHWQHTSKFNNLHTQVVTPSGTSTGSTHPNSTTSTHRWSHHQAHPQALHVHNTQSNHAIAPICAPRETKKVPRNYIITLGIPPKSITQPYYHSWNTISI